MRSWQPTPNAGKVLEACRKLVQNEVKVVANRQFGGDYHRVATIAAAVAEAMICQESASAADLFVGTLARTHRANREFIAEFAKARTRIHPRPA
jgi:hypothetical protein